MRVKNKGKALLKKGYSCATPQTAVPCVRFPAGAAGSPSPLPAPLQTAAAELPWRCGPSSPVLPLGLLLLSLLFLVSAYPWVCHFSAWSGRSGAIFLSLTPVIPNAFTAEMFWVARRGRLTNVHNLGWGSKAWRLCGKYILWKRNLFVFWSKLRAKLGSCLFPYVIWLICFIVSIQTFGWSFLFSVLRCKEILYLKVQLLLTAWAVFEPWKHK